MSLLAVQKRIPEYEKGIDKFDAALFEKLQDDLLLISGKVDTFKEHLNSTLQVFMGPSRR